VDKEPVAICRLKRVAADFKEDIRDRLPKAPAAKNGKRVACVGGGPASLTVARDLAVLGYQVTVFDNGAAPGGMMRSQIPKFRLPDEVIDEECGYIIGLGVETRYNQWIGSLRDLRAEGWDAVFVGTGAPRGRDAPIPGANEFLTRVNLMQGLREDYETPLPETAGKQVLVIGGGNTAMDAARTARRLGAERVVIAYRRTKAEMPARVEELHHAEEEGIDFELLCAPLEILGTDRKWVRGLRCVRIVHGKGLGSPGREPVLKGLVRGWLMQRAEVLAYCQARATEGGAGALVTLLKSQTPCRRD